MLPLRFSFFVAVFSAICSAGAAWAQTSEEDAIWNEAVERAEAGSAVAQCELGELVVRGQQAFRGMPVAASWFSKAAEQDALCGLLRMGELHRSGDGVSKDEGLSDRYYERAMPQVLQLAREGDLEMQILLAQMHHKGLGTKVDLELAGFWYKTAADALEPMVTAGDVVAHKKLGNILVIGIGVDRDVERAGRLYEFAAESGDRAGHYLAGLMWFTGRAKHPVDHARGFRWLLPAADADHPRSQYFVGTALADGLGVEADPVEAAKWLTLAEERGVGAARAAMKDLREKAPAEAVQKGVARAAEWKPVHDRETAGASNAS